MVFIDLVDFPPHNICMPLTSTRKPALAIPSALVMMLKSHSVTLPVLFPLQWLPVSVTDEYKTDGRVAEPHQMDLMGLKLPMVSHRLVSHYAGLCTLIVKATDQLSSLVLSKCQDPHFDFDIMQKMDFRSCIYISVHRLSVLTFEIAEGALELHEKTS